MLYLAFLAAVHFQASTPIRSGCESGDQVVGEASAGTAAQIRMSVTTPAGRCFQIKTEAGTGWVPASALAGTEDFDKSVRAAPYVTQSSKPAPTPQSQARQTQANPLVSASQLMQDKQPKAALQLIEAAMKARGESADALVLAGMAARAADDPRTALSYLEQAQKLRPDTAVESVIASLRKEVAGDKSNNKLLGGRFLLRYDEGAIAPETARQAIAVLDSEYARISAELGCHPSEQIVTIVQSPEAYRASTDAAEWSGGQFDGHRIRIPLARDGFGPRARTVFAHEIVHACLASLGDWPMWLHEGLAQKLSGMSAPAQTHHKVRSLLRQGALPRLDKVSQSWSRMSPEHAANAYAYALVATESLYDMYPSTGISSVLRNPGQMPRITAELDRILTQ